METIYNITSEITNLNDYLTKDPTLLIYNSDFNDINSYTDITTILDNISNNEIDKAEYPHQNDYLNAKTNLWRDGVLQLERIERTSNLYQWLLHWYHTNNNLQNHVRSAYLTNDALYYVHGIGYDALDADLLDGNGDGQTYHKFMNYVNTKDDTNE